MERDGDGRVSTQEYITKLQQLEVTTITNMDFFTELDKDEDGSLDFSDVITLFYIIESGRSAFCDGCGVCWKNS
ncbi:hypothetical protein DITRI_Ditri08aG0029100 [Diplodiscus trichospermus]